MRNLNEARQGLQVAVHHFRSQVREHMIRLDWEPAVFMDAGHSLCELVIETPVSLRSMDAQRVVLVDDAASGSLVTPVDCTDEGAMIAARERASKAGFAMIKSNHVF